MFVENFVILLLKSLMLLCTFIEILNTKLDITLLAVAIVKNLESRK